METHGHPAAVEQAVDRYLTFALDEVFYGLPIENVVEIIGMQPITPVPRVPGYLRGVINLRGQVIPVMDVRLRFEMPARAYDDRTCIIVTQVGAMRMGLVVDTVSEVLDIKASDVEVVGSTGAFGGDNAYLEGIGKVEGDVKLLLNAERLIITKAAAVGEVA